MHATSDGDPLATAIWKPPVYARQSRVPGDRSAFAARPSMPLRDGTTGRPESLMEHDAILILEARPDVVRVLLQPPAVTYVAEDGTVHRHTIDLVAIHRDRTRTAVIVKAARLANARGTRGLMAILAVQTPRAVATRWLLLTERQITRDRVHDAALVRLAREIPDAAADDAVLAVARASAGPTTIRDLATASGIGPGALEAVARLVGHGSLIVFHGRLDHDGVVAVVAADGARP